jgi:hypothetical protein
MQSQVILIVIFILKNKKQLVNTILFYFQD